MNRIEMLQQLLAQNPSDAFARYGLAMAYAAEGQVEEALGEYTALIGYNPDYVPAYQMSAQTLAKLGRSNEAVERLLVGIDTARRTGNQHAAEEMQSLLDELGG